MGKRGPKPRGEYTGKTAIFSTRIKPETKAKLVEATKVSRRSLSQELEHRLRRSFDEENKAVEFYGDVGTATLVKLLGVVINAVAKIKTPGVRWVDDPHVFDQVAKGVMGALELFRPPGPISDPFGDVGGDLRGKLAALELMKEIQLADPTLPFAQGSNRQHALAGLKSGLGELVGRPQPYGYTAREHQQLREIAIAFHPLRRKAEQSPEAMTRGERRELERMAGQIQALLEQRHQRGEVGVKPQTKRRASK